MVNNARGDSLIGVYKRCLRIGLELHRRGHEVAIICPGRGELRDETVSAAQGRIRFIELPLRAYFHSSARYKRRCVRKAVRAFAPDVVVVGEVPMRGILLDAAVSAVELRIPTVILDNASKPSLAAKFLNDHGAIADGIALMGPSSFQMKDPPPHYCGIPPFIKRASEGVAQRLGDWWPRSRRVITVLGYEQKAQELAIALMRAVPFVPCRVVVISNNIPATQARLETLPKRIRAKFIVTALPDEESLFEAMRRSNLVMGKMGFMQISESICLQVPFLGIYYRGCCPVWALPFHTLRYVGQTSSTKATLSVCLRLIRLLYIGKRVMQPVHSASFDGLVTVCEFLEKTAGRLRDGVTEDSAGLGYTTERLQHALQARHPKHRPEVEWVRVSPMWDSRDAKIDMVIAGCRSGARRQIVALQGIRFANPEAGQRAKAVADPSRSIWFQSQDATLWLEEEPDELHAPEP
ncbi:glycosyltransferase [Occallatibacter riparius]|uniref:Glycosyltransferase n=1 Tax=Occallatibacter riparius TaxID=1002689 RepID=A0A9J7BW89_9BACT|nr:glycosyltransferase [Occallatibacter riparius]UWZ86983.1 glycosyltransferase [Occallatibacter riparius]